MLASHDENVRLFEQSFAELEAAMVSDENKAIYHELSAELADYWILENEILTLGTTGFDHICDLILRFHRRERTEKITLCKTFQPAAKRFHRL